MKRVTIGLLIVVLGTLGSLGWLLWKMKQPTREKNVHLFRPTAPPSAKRLERDVRKLSVDFHPRTHKDLNNLDAAAAYILAELREAGVQADYQTYDQERFRNVVGFIGDEASFHRVVVGAHYDAVEGTPGADDNASGVAVMLELARLLTPIKHMVRIDFVAYSLEEPPYFATDLMGSAIHAQRLKHEQVDVKAMISLEMLGFFSDKPGSQKMPMPGLQALYPTTGDFIAVVGRLEDADLAHQTRESMRVAGPLPVHSINAPSFVPGIDLSDHRSYWEAGFPAIMITDTAYLRNPNYHQPTDTADTLDYKRMADVVRHVYAAVMRLTR